MGDSRRMRKLMEKYPEKVKHIDPDFIKAAFEQHGALKGGQRTVEAPPRSLSEIEAVKAAGNYIKDAQRKALKALTEVDGLQDVLQESGASITVSDIAQLEENIGKAQHQYTLAMQAAQSGSVSRYSEHFRRAKDIFTREHKVAGEAYDTLAAVAGDDKDKNSPTSNAVSTLRNIRERLSAVTATINEKDIANVREQKGQARL